MIVKRRTPWVKCLEMASNVTVLLVAFALLAAIVSNRGPHSAKRTFATGLQKTRVKLPSIDFDQTPQTLLLVLNTTSDYCQKSLPFYKRLLAQHDIGSQRTRTRIVAVFADDEMEVELYKRQKGFAVESVSQINLQALNVAVAPTLVLVDSNGRVLDSWVGKLSETDEDQVERLLGFR